MMFRRLSATVGAVAVAMLTTVSVVVTVGPAQASTVTPIPPELVKIGEAVKHAGPGVAARNATKATSLIPGPAGLIFKTISLGTTAYQTRDYWLPFVAGALDGDASTAMAPGPVGYVKEVTNIDGVASASTAINMAVVVTYTIAPGNNLFGTVTWECLSPSGAVTSGNVSIGYPNPNPGTTVPTDRNVVSVSACSGLAGAIIKTLSVTFYPPPSYHNAGEFTYAAAIATEALDSVVTCRRPDGTTYTVTRTSTRSLTEQSEGTEWLQVGACAVGDTPVTMRVDSKKGTDAPKTIGDYPLSGTDADHDQAYPLCAGDQCLYRIRVDGQSCTTGVENCTHWSYIWSQQAYRVECFYGAYPVAVSECLFMERAYDSATGARTATQANTDGNPDTYTAPAPSPPRTSPTSSPSPSSTSSSSPSPSSSATGSPVPAPDPGTGTSTPPSEAAGARCFPSGWAVFNPFEWVYKPVMCALRDAFVPDQALMASRASSTRAQLETKGPGPAIGQLVAVVESAGGSGGCMGPAMPFAVAGVSETLHPFAACSNPMATAAMYAKALATVVIVVGASLSIVRAISAAFGLNFSMGRGGTTDGD